MNALGHRPCVTCLGALALDALFHAYAKLAPNIRVTRRLGKPIKLGAKAGSLFWVTCAESLALIYPPRVTKSSGPTDSL